MASIGSIFGFGPRSLPTAEPLTRATGMKAPGLEAPAGGSGPGGVKFENVIDRALTAVEDKQAAAAATTRSVLLGENPRLHESMIAMQESSLSFSLMIEVRNKVVESYQELMRMPV